MPLMKHEGHTCAKPLEQASKQTQKESKESFLTSSVEGMPLMNATSLPLPFTRTPTCQSGL
jgi:hypothetical protein